MGADAHERIVPLDEDTRLVMTRKQWIVTYDIPVYVSVSAPDEDTAKDLARTYWLEDGVYRHIEDGLEPTSWYLGEPYDDIDVSEDDTPPKEDI